MTETQHESGTPGELAPAVGNWVLDPAATTIAFTTKAMWVLPVKGSFAATGGAGTVTPDGSATGSLTIDAASVSTGMSKRDAHLRTKDFFDVARFPTLRYEVTSVAAAGGELRFTGSFTVAGQTHPLVLTGTATPAGDRLTVLAHGELDRTQWGLTWAKMGAGVHNDINISAVFTRA